MKVGRRDIPKVYQNLVCDLTLVVNLKDGMVPEIKLMNENSIIQLSLGTMFQEKLLTVELTNYSINALNSTSFTKIFLKHDRGMY